jgi:hypothetical protein
MDFTVLTYRNLLNVLIRQGFSFLTFEKDISSSVDRLIVLRHDVDALPQNSLQFARIEAKIGVKGTYFFRIVPGSLDEKIIKEICSLGHEVGYHYEDISLAAKRQKAEGSRRKGNNKSSFRPFNSSTEEEELVKIAIESFKVNLAKLREIAPIKTICMHGSPMSRWDSRLLWKYYDYHDFGIIGEPYFDINFNKLLYLTDTGRRWDGELISIRDKAQRTRHNGQGIDSLKVWKVKPEEMNSRTPHNADRKPFPPLHSTFDIIKAAEEGKLPDKIMMTFHPQRWTDKPMPWIKELVWQNVKNVGKYFLVKLRK